MNQVDKFCPSCAAALEIKEVFGQQRPMCPDCGRVIFYDPKVAVLCIVPRDGQVLMMRRATDLGYGLWGLPGGYVDRGEVVEKAAAREVWEETGLVVETGDLIGLFSEPGDPVMVAVYEAKETGGTMEAGPEALEVGFFSIDALPELAFPRDQEVLAKWQLINNNG
ncbi:MAG TPA: NUDIX domain-containing protein [Dehalococcoidia bacterium]|nr:NUDIX domain-containing protein [Dehalococcoidia bacterium]HIL32254.1 NUDIX domain-containing protein [Dehalococcoidia bacterium]